MAENHSHRKLHLTASASGKLKISRSQTLKVWLNARCVGQLTRATDGGLSFVYDANWLNWHGATPISTSMPLQTQKYADERVRNVFENLLPDVEQVRESLAARFKADGTDPFSLLAAIGMDCVGALQLLPTDIEPGHAGLIAGGEALSEEDLAKMLRQLRQTPLGLTDEYKNDFRISIAGAQDKTALQYYQSANGSGIWRKPIGTSATTHIFKPAIGMLSNGIDMRDSVENEWVCLKLCAHLGLKTTQADIAIFEDQKVLIVERFDRLFTKDKRLLRLPQEDFCQALNLPSSRKYQRDAGPNLLDMFEHLKESNNPLEDRLTLMRAQLVFYLLGATDGHAKNFSIRHIPKSIPAQSNHPAPGFILAPIYDVLTAQHIVDKGQISQNQFKLALSVGRSNHYRMDEITRRHFQETADLAGLPKSAISDLIDDLSKRLPNAIDTILAEAQHKIPSELTESLHKASTKRLETLQIM